LEKSFESVVKRCCVKSGIRRDISYKNAGFTVNKLTSE